MPSILGYIALATAGNELLRGQAAARFEGATLAGLGVGIIVAPKLFEAIGPNAFFLNAVLYGVSFLIYWLGVKDRPASARPSSGEHVGFRRYGALIRSSHVLLLAPTWIAINASIGLWMSQSLFQFAKANPKFPDQVLMGGFTANEITIAAIAIAVVFGAGPAVLGQPVQEPAADDDHRLRDRRRRRARRRRASLVNHSAHAADRGRDRRRSPSPASACSSSPARRRRRWACSPTSPSASRATAARSWACTSVFLAIGQIIGALIGGVAADLRGIDGMLDRDGRPARSWP